MLSKELNDLVTRVGPGTPMGEVLRRYWTPVTLSARLPEPDGEPLQVKLLGERLVAYRDTDGQVGLLDEFCPHRQASLWLGRNEEGGLRCVFHGWKFDRSGACTDMPCEPAATDFKDKIRHTAYPTVEMGGVVWAYMGPVDKQPPPPRFEWTQVPATHRHVNHVWEECNWLQGLEGGIDSAHSSFLHRNLPGASIRGGFSAGGFRARAGAPKLEVRLADWGFTYASLRDLGDEGTYARTYQYVLPFHQVRAQQFSRRGEVSGSTSFRPNIAGHMWVPMDDENTMVYNWIYTYADEPLLDGEDIERQSGRGPEDFDPVTFRKRQHRDNRWLIDRQAQKLVNYTGIEGSNAQDHAVQESMGPIADRSREHLGTIDRAIIAARRILIDAATAVRDGGDPPDLGESYYRVRSIERVLRGGEPWWEALGPEILGLRQPELVGA